MFIDHFGLTVNPFGLSPKLDFLYRSDPFEESMAHLLFGLDNSEAIIMITGSIGTGKTMSIQSFLTHLGPEFDSALVTNTRVNALELLKLILEDLQIGIERGMDKSDALILFKDYLGRTHTSGKRVLIVVDEAQNLSVDSLEELRLLTNLGQGESQPVQIILVGQPELEDIVNGAELAQLRQRIRVHYRLKHLDRVEVEEYINHRMVVAGGESGVFRSRALDRIHSLSKGVPRLINTLAGEGLLSAFVAGRKDVREEDIEDGVHVVTGISDQVMNTEEPPPVLGVDRNRLQVLETSSMSVVSAGSISNEPGEVDGSVTRYRVKRGSAGRWAFTALVILVFFMAVKQGYPQQTWKWVQSSFQDILNTKNSVAESELMSAEANISSPRVNGAGFAPDTSSQGSTRSNMGDPFVVSSSRSAEVHSVTLQDSGSKEMIPVPKSSSSVVPELYLHVSSFRSAAKADLQAKRLVEEGVVAKVQKWEEGGKLWYRVYLGPFSGYETAVNEANQLLEDKKIQYYKVID